jgi:hypothetical protein
VACPAIGANAPTDPFAPADRAIADAEKAIAEMTKCSAESAALKRDITAKKKEIISRYGSVPPSYSNLLTIKNARFQNQLKVCNALNSGALFDRAMNILRGVEPKSMDGFKERRDRIEELRSQFNDVVSQGSQSR